MQVSVRVRVRVQVRVRVRVRVRFRVRVRVRVKVTWNPKPCILPCSGGRQAWVRVRVQGPGLASGLG